MGPYLTLSLTTVPHFVSQQKLGPQLIEVISLVDHSAMKLKLPTLMKIHVSTSPDQKMSPSPQSGLLMTNYAIWSAVVIWTRFFRATRLEPDSLADTPVYHQAITILKLHPSPNY